jgi:lysozyme
VDARKPIALLSVSVALVSSIYLREAFEPVAQPPLPGDVPTYGYGSTTHADGSPVQNGETITEPEARALADWQVRNVYEAELNRCAHDLRLLTREKDFLVYVAHNLGAPKVCKSGMVREFRKGNYAAGCAYILKYMYFQKKDCRIPANKCGGIPKDRQFAYQMCMGVS